MRVKLMIAIVDRRDLRHLREALIDRGVRFTELTSTGGFLEAANTTLLIGLTDDQVDPAVALFRQHCHAREEAVSIASPDTRLYADPVGAALTVTVGGAQILILNVEKVVSV